MACNFPLGYDSWNPEPYFENHWYRTYTYIVLTSLSLSNAVRVYVSVCVSVVCGYECVRVCVVCVYVSVTSFAVCAMQAITIASFIYVIYINLRSEWETPEEKMTKSVIYHSNTLAWQSTTCLSHLIASARCPLHTHTHGKSARQMMFWECVLVNTHTLLG